LNDEQVREYLDTLKQPPTSWQVEMIDEAIKDRIPIMERDGIDFLKQMLRLKRPDRILEIGSAIGYSALQMIDAVPSARVITVERDQARAKRAKYYFNRYNQDQTIELIEGDAFDVAEQVRTKAHMMSFLLMQQKDNINAILNYTHLCLLIMV